MIATLERIIEKLSLIDETLMSYEDWMHNDDGKKCTEARKLVVDIKKDALDIRKEAVDVIDKINDLHNNHGYFQGDNLKVLNRVTSYFNLKK